MPFIGNKPSAVPLASADIADSIITSAKIVDSTIVNADINTNAAITTEKLSLISTASVASVTAKGTPSVSDGYIQLNCEQNSHGIKIKSPPHSAGANYTLVMPSATGTSLQSLRMNSGATALEFATPASGSFTFLAETSASNVASVSLNGYFTSDYDVYKIFIDGGYGASQTTCTMTFNTTGSYTEQTSNYYFMFGGFLGSDNTHYPIFDTSYSSTTKMMFNYFSTTQAQGGVSEITIYNPLSTTYHKYITGNSSSHTVSYAGFGTFNGGWRDATAITGVNFKMSSGNIYARKIRLYGVKNT